MVGNRHRPHSSLGNPKPIEFARKRQDPPSNMLRNYLTEGRAGLAKVVLSRDRLEPCSGALCDQSGNIAGSVMGARGIQG